MNLHTSSLVTAVLFAALLPAQNQGIQLAIGVDGAVEVPFNAAMVPPTGLTVEAWITYDDSTIPTGSLYYWPTIARQNPVPQQETWLLRVGAANNNTRNVEFSVRNGANALNVLTYAFVPGEFVNWTHLAATYDGQVMTIYKNGVQVSTRNLGVAYEVQNFGGLLRIGNGDNTTPGREVWNGKIAELRVWPMPRSAAEITATMNQELMAMPGKVLTFNLDGHYIDTSSGLIGAAVGALSFVPGPAITMVMPIGTAVGQNTTTCARTIDIAMGSVPTLGNSAFTIWCTKAPRPANSPLGILVAGGQAAPAAQPPFAGVSLAFAITSVLAEVVYVPGTFGLGLQKQLLPIPSSAAFMGTTLYAQFGFADAQCGPQGFSASNGLQIVVQ
jgi:hypothetical protein